MKFTKEQIETSVTKLIQEGKNEDAVLLIMYELGQGSERNLSREQAILQRLNEFLKIPFTLEDLQISLAILYEKKFIEC